MIKARIKDIVFVTATDGNHGRGVAWAAEQLGLRAVVYMPKARRRYARRIFAGMAPNARLLN